MEDEIQMYGRNGRQEGSDALSMTMVESWLYNIDLSDGNKEFDGGENCDINPQVTDTVNDPNQAVTPSSNSERTTKQTCVGCAAVRCYQCNICICKFHAFYLNDESPNSKHPV
jgi:hypothetical protein